MSKDLPNITVIGFCEGEVVCNIIYYIRTPHQGYESMTMTMTIVLSQTSLMQAQCKTSLDVETWRR